LPDLRRIFCLIMSLKFGRQEKSWTTWKIKYFF
jgi:hypothetical protein